MEHSAQKDSLALPVKAAPLTDSSVQKGNTIKAKFTGFELGDASHFLFTDESGKEWDFADVDDRSVEFAMELPEKEANTTNQGWAPNKKLLGKWYNLKYTTRNQPQYIDGPMADVLVVTEVKPLD